MNTTRLLSLVFCLCLIGALTPRPASAEAVIDPAYPGIIPGSSGSATPIAVGLLVAGCENYYRLYGHWPADWAAVRQSGLVQVDLFDYNLAAIDPDDGQVDSLGDVVYVPPTASTPPQYAVLKNSATSQVQVIDLQDPGDDLSTLCSNSGLANLEQISQDQARLSQLALALVINFSLAEYHATTNDWPDSWAEFIDSGFCPLDAKSKSPVSGAAIHCDGSPDDFAFIVKNDYRCVYATDSQGATPWKIN